MTDVYFISMTNRFNEVCHFWDVHMGKEIVARWADSLGRGTMWRISPTTILEIKESSEAWIPGVRLAFELAVPGEVDEWFARMLDAGVIGLHRPVDRQFGHRNATVVDPGGIQVTCFALIDEKSILERVSQ